MSKMKKLSALSVLAAAVIILMGATSCDPNKKGKKSEEPVVTEAVNVENAIGIAHEYMNLNYGTGYRWYECCILMKDYLDEDTDGAVEGVSNVFQVLEPHGSSIDTHVVLIATNGENTTVEVKHGFWVEDFPLNEEAIEITYEQAFERVMAANYPKPHSRHCVLRKEVGPVAANTQYIFGNNSAQLYVDAQTGEVTDTNPVYDGSGFGMPLGEWP